MTIKLVKRKYYYNDLESETNDVYVNDKLHTSAVGNKILSEVVKNITEHLYVNN